MRWKPAVFVIFLGILSLPGLSKPKVTQPDGQAVGEQVPSEDPVLKDFHSLGLIDGFTDIYRCACPVRDIAKAMAATQPSDEEMSEAVRRMKRFYHLGIRTVISFQNPDGDEDHAAQVNRAIALERAAAGQAGLTFVPFPMSNSGKNSLEDMSDQAVLDWLNQVSAAIFSDAKEGGVAFHCSAGHDRTGIVAAYLRMKVEHWPVDQAIAEMRRYGHNWPKYSSNGGISSWHEEHLKAIAKMLESSN